MPDPRCKLFNKGDIFSKGNYYYYVVVEKTRYNLYVTARIIDKISNISDVQLLDQEFMDIYTEGKINNIIEVTDDSHLLTRRNFSKGQKVYNSSGEEFVFQSINSQNYNCQVKNSEGQFLEFRKDCLLVKDKEVYNPYKLHNILVKDSYLYYIVEETCSTNSFIGKGIPLADLVPDYKTMFLTTDYIERATKSTKKQTFYLCKDTGIDWDWDFYLENGYINKDKDIKRFRPFKIGDKVRRAKGHTCMIISGVEENGNYKVSYLSNIKYIGIKNAVELKQSMESNLIEKRVSYTIKNKNGLVKWNPNDAIKEGDGKGDGLENIFENEHLKIKTHIGDLTDHFYKVHQIPFRKTPEEFAKEIINVNHNGDNVMTTSVKKGKLFVTKEKKPRYGEYLTTDSSGRFVLEMKGKEADIEAFKVDDIEEVIPYTFKVKAINTSKSYECHYEGVKESVKVDDVLISDSCNFYIVTDIDTKCSMPEGKFKGRKLATTKV